MWMPGVNIDRSLLLMNVCRLRMGAAGTKHRRPSLLLTNAQRKRLIPDFVKLTAVTNTLSF